MSIIFLIVLGLIAAGAGIYFLTKNKNKGTSVAVITPPNEQWTITNSHAGLPVTVSADRNHGGAIYSIKWGDTEFINYDDNGRLLQTAWTMNGHGEGENPTEGGAFNVNTSVVLAARTDGNILRTYSQPGYWETFNGQITSPHKLGKTVQFVDTNVLHHQITITIVGDQQSVNVEGLTVYTPQTFTRFFQDGVEITPPTQMWYNLTIPTIMATADLSHAICLYGPTNLYHYGCGIGNGAWPKLDCSSYQANDVKAGDYSWDSYTIFGTYDQVVASLNKLKGT